MSSTLFLVGCWLRPWHSQFVSFSYAFFELDDGTHLLSLVSSLSTLTVDNRILFFGFLRGKQTKKKGIISLFCLLSVHFSHTVVGILLLHS